MRKIPLYAYVASNNPRGAAEVIASFGFRPPQSQDEVLRGLRHVQSVYGKEGIIEIAKVHPDRDLIIGTIPSSKKKVKEETSNSCGCSSNANGEVNSKTQEELSKLKEEKLLSEIKNSKSPLTKEDIADEVKKVLDKTNPFIKNNLPYIALGGVALFFIYGTLTK